ncbi:hypothetical protein Cgig2_017934 [Carnegiea gigantea]|uniref:Uncharacterized protein n=1 Tax=Carnegiea gigantea TaxID=171969 RepID=A0A9Q1K927_9CARY|nr:hypothetical protein Cgig2_017934 [Carnegiea gigantea]
MNVLSYSINKLKGLYDISAAEVGQHFYWQIGSAVIAVRNPQTALTDGQNFFEYILEFVEDVSKTQIGEEYRPWVPFIETMGSFTLENHTVTSRESAALTNDINITVALALLTSVAYFYVGLTKKRLGYFVKYIQPTPILLPVNILEDFTKPLSLNDLVVLILVSLVPLLVHVPIMFLRLFTSGNQALICATLETAYIGESMEGHH